jgi:hypothetical protein
MFNGYWGTFRGAKCLGCDSDYAPTSTIKVKNEWNYISGSNMYRLGVDTNKYSTSSSCFVVVYVP